MSHIVDPTLDSDGTPRVSSHDYALYETMREVLVELRLMNSHLKEITELTIDADQLDR